MDKPSTNNYCSAIFSIHSRVQHCLRVLWIMHQPVPNSTMLQNEKRRRSVCLAVSGSRVSQKSPKSIKIHQIGYEMLRVAHDSIIFINIPYWVLVYRRLSSFSYIFFIKNCAGHPWSSPMFSPWSSLAFRVRPRYRHSQFLGQCPGLSDLRMCRSCHVLI